MQFDVRGLYLMKRVCHNNPVTWLLAWVWWPGKYKIGISGNAKKRRKNIDEDLPGSI